MNDITRLLERAASGEADAANRLMPIVYDRLRAIAHYQLDHTPPQKTLSTTGLVHEAYLALFGDANLDWRDRGHFFTYASRAMRNILIDRVRERAAEKRVMAAERIDANDTEIAVEDESIALLALDQALQQLACHHPRLVQVVELRFFAGLTVEETAASLGLEAITIIRDWRKARAFLYRALDRRVAGDAGA